MVICVKLGKEAEGLDYPTYPGELGKKIYESVSKQAWKGWVQHQTMLINEYRINPLDPKARKFIEEEMDKYFFGEGSAAPTQFVPPSKK
jgi:Fe-S cluster biosynthesis and repair protein YggX